MRKIAALPEVVSSRSPHAVGTSATPMPLAGLLAASAPTNR